MSKRTALLTLGMIIIIGAVARSWELTARSLWFDEAFSWRLIQFPWGPMIARAAADVHPPLYYIVLKAWSIVFGHSLLALRGFSVTAAAATIGATYLFTSSAAKSRWIGLLAATLLALSGWQIQFAWEARMYTLGTLFALLSSWALLRAVISEPPRLGRWLLYALLATLFAAVHYYALFTIVGQVIFIVGYLLVITRGRVGELLQSRALWYALLAGTAAAVVCLPWLPVFLRQNSQVQMSFWIGPMNRWSIPDTLYHMFIPLKGSPAHRGVGWFIIALLPLLGTIGVWLMTIQLRPRYHSTGTPRWLVVLLGLTPFVLGSVFSLLGQSLYQDRFFIFAHLFILIALAWVIGTIPWPYIRVAVAGLVILGSAVATGHFWQELQIRNRPGAQAAARYTATVREAGEPLVVSSPFIYFPILYYTQEEYVSTELPHLYSETGELAHFAGQPILTPADIIGPAVFAEESSVLWIVDTTGFGGAPLRPPAPWQARETRVFPEIFDYQGDISVTKYIR